MKKTVAMFLFMGLSVFSAQAQLDNYKYFVVPKRFNAFKDINQHQSSTLVKFLLTKYGFDPLYDDAIPEELFLNKCLGLTSQIEDNSTYLQTVVAIVFYDCRGQEVFRTQEGKSKNKVFKEAYSEAIQEALQTMAILTHNYQGSEQTPVDAPKAVGAPDPVETTPEKQIEFPAAEPTAVAVVAEEASEALAKEEALPGASYWKETASNNGYILTYPEEELTWVIMKTSSPEVFMAISTTKQGVAFKGEKGWRLEYYLGDLLKVEHIQLAD
ncbi:MAG: hypothetical protein KJO04_09030 [Bacteroidia bacterium]|nr:hypothetical protein [Bacteroidia bacterium]